MPAPAATARAIVDANRYMTLGTVDEAGRPWVSPVYYAPHGYREFLWVSSPDAAHSRNLASRPDVAIVIFDSTAAIGQGQALYIKARAEQLEGAELERGIELFSAVSESHGAPSWTVADVSGPALHRLYRATASEHSMLDPVGHPAHGRRIDHRTAVEP